MPAKVKETVENVKSEAKNYYKNKSMIFRYVLIGFLFILIVLQFLLPTLDKNKSTEINIDEVVNTPISQDIDNEDNLDFLFLNNVVDLNNSDYDNVFTDIVSDIPALQLLYKKSLSFLPDIKILLEKQNIPTDFQYLALINRLDNPIWLLPSEAIEAYNLIVDEDIDETLNFKKSTYVTISHIEELYNQFEDWDLVLVAYLLGSDELVDILDEQSQESFDEVYLQADIMSLYHEVMAYKYVMENISDYIDTTNIKSYKKKKTEIIQPGKVNDLIERAEEEGYSYKDIKQLNPWILGTSLPKVKLDVEVYEN